MTYIRHLKLFTSHLNMFLIINTIVISYKQNSLTQKMFANNYMSEFGNKINNIHQVHWFISRDV